MTKRQIIGLLRRRRRLADELMEVSHQVDVYIEEHNLEDKVEDCDWCTGCEIYCNPYASSERVIKVIKENIK